MTIIRITEHIEGVEDYLTHGNKKGRSLDREQLDNRVPIYGDLEVFKAANRYVQKHKKWKHNYWHITLSPAWIDHGMRRFELRQMVISTLEYYFHLYARDRLAAYAEIHYPKYQSDIDPKTREIKQRLPHVHLVVSKLDLWSNNQIRILPYKKQVAEAFQAWINHQHPGNIGRQHVVEPQQDLQAVHKYQDWHRQCNSVDLEKVPYAPSTFLKAPMWQPYKQPLAIIQKPLKIITSSKSVTFEKNPTTHRFNVLNGFRKWLAEFSLYFSSKRTVDRLNSDVSMAAIIEVAKEKFGLLSDNYSIKNQSLVGPEQVVDIRTNRSYVAIYFSYHILHMDMLESIEWLKRIEFGMSNSNASIDINNDDLQSELR